MDTFNKMGNAYAQRDRSGKANDGSAKITLGNTYISIGNLTRLSSKRRDQKNNSPKFVKTNSGQTPSRPVPYPGTRSVPGPRKPPPPPPEKK